MSREAGMQVSLCHPLYLPLPFPFFSVLSQNRKNKWKEWIYCASFGTAALNSLLSPQAHGAPPACLRMPASLPKAGSGCELLIKVLP